MKNLPRRSALAIVLVSLLPLSARAAEPASVPTTATATAPAAGTRLKAGDVAPEFTVLGPKGETIKLSDFRGKVVIVDVSATWCGPCQAAMPNNDRVFKKYAAQGVVLLGVTADDAREAYDGWLKRSEGKYTFTMTFDPAGKDGWKNSVFNTAYQVTGFPTMFVVGRDGKLVETVGGGGPGEDYRLEYALARAGVKVDLASIPPEPKNDGAPKSVPLVGKTPAMRAGGGMVGMGGGMTMAGPALIPAKFGNIAAGEAVPDFTVTGADGKPVKLSAFRGKNTLVHFVTANGPQAWLTELAAAYRPQGLVTLVVFAATERGDFDAWVAKNPAPGFAIAWDPAGKAWAEGVTNTGFGVGMFPATALVDADGKLITGTIGMGARVALIVKAALAKSKTVKLTADDAALVLEALFALEAAKATIPFAMITPKPAGPAAAAPKPPLLGAGAIAPDFTMLDVDGKAVKLSDYKGKVVILDFWATWCGPCLASFPHTQEIAARYKDQGVVVLASGTSDTAAAFKKWIPANQSKYPDVTFVYDPHVRPESGSEDAAAAKFFEERASGKLYHVTGIPTQFVIGRDGVIGAAIVGNGGKEDARTEAALAKLGVKVDAATTARGDEQLVKDVEQAKQAAAAAVEAAKNPPPPFHESFGKLKAGDAVADFELLTTDGQLAKFSDYGKGKTTVIGLWSGGYGPPAPMQAHWDAMLKKYSAAGVVFLGVGGYASTAEVAAWAAKNAGKFSFPLVVDPAGAAPKPPKPMDELTDDEKKTFIALSREHYPKTLTMKMAGVVPPVPTTIVVNAAGQLVGWMAGYGTAHADGLANLLFRAGVKLAAEDMPAKIYTAEETKEKPPAPKVTLIAVGATAPDFTTTDAAGKPVKLSDYKGKVVILDFWATWCGPCIASMPHTQEVAKEYKEQGVVVLASCTSDGRAAFEAWVAKHQESYPDMIFSHDPLEKSDDRASRKLYGVGGIPQQIIIGADGKVVARVTGYLKGEVILEGALAQAGLKVAPAIVAKAKSDRAKRGQ